MTVIIHNIAPSIDSTATALNRGATDPKLPADIRALCREVSDARQRRLATGPNRPPGIRGLEAVIRGALNMHLDGEPDRFSEAEIAALLRKVADYYAGNP